MHMEAGIDFRGVHGRGGAPCGNPRGIIDQLAFSQDPKGYLE